MYTRILVAVENSAADRDDPRRTSSTLARLTGARLLLVHVADGWAARNFDQLNLRESEEMQADRAYLDQPEDEPDGQGPRGRDAPGHRRPGQANSSASRANRRSI